MAKKSSNKNWIQKAIKRPGAFTKKAENKNMSVSKFARKVTANPKKYDLRTVRQANLAKTLRKFEPGGDRALPTGAMTSTLSSPGMGSFQALQQGAFEMQEYAKTQYEEQKAKEKAAEEAKKQQLKATATQAGSKETLDAARQGIQLLNTAKNAKAVTEGASIAKDAATTAKDAGTVVKAAKLTKDASSASNIATSAAKVGETAVKAGSKVANVGAYNPIGLGLNLAGSAIQAASDDNDPTKYNAGETTGTLMKGAGTGLGMAGTLTALAPALAIPGIGWAAAGVGALTAGAIALHRRNKARKEQKELDSQKAAQKSRLDAGYTDSWNQAFTRSGTDMGYNVGNSASNSYVPAQQQMMQYGGYHSSNTNHLLSSLNQVDASKPVNPGLLAQALDNRPSSDRLLSHAVHRFSNEDLKTMDPSRIGTNPYVLTSYQKVSNQMNSKQYGGAHAGSLLSSLNQVDISKPVNEFELSHALQRRPFRNNLMDYTMNSYPDPRNVNPQTITTNPYVLIGYQKALKKHTENIRGYETGGKVPGGEIKPLQGGAVEFIGKTHKEGGIMIDPYTEVENGETMDKVNMVDRRGDYIFSNYLKIGGKTFAQRHKEILNKKGSQKEIQDLAKMQETVAAKDGEAGRTPKKIMQTAGEYNPWSGSAQAEWAVQGNKGIDKEATIGETPTGNLSEEQWGAFYENYDGFQKDPEKFYEDVYIPKVREYFKNNPDQAYAQLQEMVKGNDPNADNFRKMLLDKDGNMLPKEEALAKAEKLATDKNVGSFHMIIPEEKITPRGIGQNQIPEKQIVPPSKSVPETPPSKVTAPPKDLPMLPLGWAQLAGPAFALKNKYPEAQMAYTSPVGRINLPRVNYNAQRAANANATNAMQRSIENSSSGPAGMASRLAALNTAREADLEIANAESQVNKALMAEEASENLKADMANAQIGADMSQFNAQMKYQSDMNKYDTKHAAVSQIGNILTEIGKGYRQNLADERVARATQLNGEYDRERMKSAARLRNSTVNIGGKEVKFRNLSPQQQNEAAAAMYMGINDPTKVQAFMEEDKKTRAQAMAPKEEETTESKKRGGRRYVTKFGKINKRTRKAK